MDDVKAAAAWTVPVAGERVSAAWDPPASGPLRTVFVCAHGAGGQMNDRSILAVTTALRPHGIGTVRFNFVYRERRSGRPDPMPKLVDCWRAVVTRVREELDAGGASGPPLVVGGRSMGGRAASVLVADGERCDGLLLLAYPLHPPGQVTKLRVEHLPRISAPVLCINGTRDPFCDRSLMDRTLATLERNWQMSWLDGADHSFHVLKSSGRTDAQVLDQVAAACDAWIAESVTGR
jgi:predicted alpha/beta-hydrolase family hydrolase